MRIMKEDHSFNSRYAGFHFVRHFFPTLTLNSEKLYKTKFRKWGVDSKHIKSSEYMAMIKKKRKREQYEPGRVTKFQLHGKDVPESKIERRETHMMKQGKVTENDTFSEVGEHYPISPRLSIHC